jgi:hypothetical protein
MIINYPDTFPCPTWAYGTDTSTYPLRTQFDNGWTRQRRAFQETGMTANLSFVMTTNMFEKWSTWVEANGWNWFVIGLDEGEGTVDNYVRLLTSPNWGYDAYDNIVAQFTVEVYPSGCRENQRPPGPAVLCKQYECDSLENAILQHSNAVIYYVWNGTGTSPQTWPNAGSATLTGQLMGTTGVYSDFGTYIDPCDPLSPMTITSNSGAQAKEYAEDQLWIGGQALGEDCTYGCLLNVRDNKTSWTTGHTNRIMFSSQAYTQQSQSPSPLESYTVKLEPATGRVYMKMRVFKPFSGTIYWYPEVYINPNLLFDVNGDAKNVLFSVRIKRYRLTQTVDIKVWVNKAIAAVGLGIYNTWADTDVIFQNNDGTDPDIFGSGVEICSDGPFSDNGGGSVTFSHQWVSSGDVGNQIVSDIGEALPPNYTDYVDPNPDCVEP